MNKQEQYPYKFEMFDLKYPELSQIFQWCEDHNMDFVWDTIATTWILIWFKEPDSATLFALTWL